MKDSGMTSGTQTENNTPQTNAQEKSRPTVRDFKSLMAFIGMILFRLRKVVLAVPVVMLAVKLALYNRENLPEQVGINLQSSGEFAQMISRDMAVMGPLGLTAACLLLMLCSKKALYPWAISLFTLVLPVMILLTNIYPA